MIFQTRYLIILVIPVLVFSGCSTQVDPVVDSNANTNTDNVNKVEEITNSFEIGTSDWGMYSSEKYRFKLKIPDWYGLYEESLTGVVYYTEDYDGIKVSVADYDDSADTIQAGDYYMYTQIDLDEMMNDLSVNESTQDINGTSVIISHQYDVSGGAFFEQAQFFVKKDLVTITISLPIDDQPVAWSSEKEEWVAAEIDKIDQGLANDDVYYNIEVLERIVKSLEIKEDPSIESLTDSNKCFRFLQGNFFTDPSSIFNIVNVKPLEDLADDWEWGNICESLDSNNLYVVSVNRLVSLEDSNAGLIQKTIELYPSAAEQIAVGGGYNFFQFYLYVDHTTELNFGSSQKIFTAGQLTPIAELAWGEALASCYVQPGNYVSDQGIVISCGSGDNGCADIERVKWNLFTGKTQYISSCSNNCDLGKSDPYILDCQP